MAEFGAESDREPLRQAQTGVAAFLEQNVDGLDRGPALGVHHVRVIGEVVEVGDVLPQGVGGHERAVAGHDPLRVERQDPLTGLGYPLERAGPVRGVIAGEGDVTGEHHALLGQVDDQVTDGVCRADLVQHHGYGADLQVESTSERGGRGNDSYVREVELAEVLPEVPAQRLVRVGVAAKRGELLGVGSRH